jgi:phosphoglycerol transferase MdoB-like AlkP superfamily enzyme
MTDQGCELNGTGATRGILEGASGKVAFLGELRPAVVWVIAGAIALALGRYLAWAEGEAANIFFTVGVSATIGAVIMLASRRVLFSTVLVAGPVMLVWNVSYEKQRATELVLHAYDVVSFFSSWSPLLGLWREHRGHAFGLAGALATLALFGWLAYRLDGTRVPRLGTAAAAALFAGLAWFGAAGMGERRHTEMYFESLYVSFFYSSWSETIEALWRGRLIEAAAQTSAARFQLPAACAPTSKPPHIILIHQESVVPPSHFPSLGYDRTLDAFFRSFDGSLHKLRVETYGGASWLTEFSVFTGLSSHAFGGMRQFVQPLMAGKIRDTLPHALARCGYRPVVFYPMLRNFVSIDRFFNGLGMREVFDARGQKATLPNERDRFYYANALAEMERHFKRSSEPLFTYIETMVTHGPYDDPYMPEVDVPGGAPGTPPGMHEFLRRLAFARQDYDFLRAELLRRFPDQQFLIVHYGDHQPLATLPLLGFREDATVEDVMQSGNQAALITYYAVDAINYAPPPLPRLDAVDVAYLGTIVLEAAGLPLSDGHRERRRLMMLCDGNYDGCPARDEVLKFHRRLIDSGLLEPR